MSQGYQSKNKGKAKAGRHLLEVLSQIKDCVQKVAAAPLRNGSTSPGTWPLNITNRTRSPSPARRSTSSVSSAASPSPVRSPTA